MPQLSDLRRQAHALVDALSRTRLGERNLTQLIHFANRLLQYKNKRTQLDRYDRPERNDWRISSSQVNDDSKHDI